LCLANLTEFARNAQEMIRQPLEERAVTIARSQMTQTFPSDFMLVAAMNP
jgi:magnesium chelatase family protein